VADDIFPPDAVAQIVRHMNGEHEQDSVYIVQAAGRSEAVSARMVDMDADGADFVVSGEDGTESAVRVPFGHRLTDRAEVRQEFVRMHMDAVMKLAGRQRRG
jgi:putative heme iron utilization protein